MRTGWAVLLLASALWAAPADEARQEGLRQLRAGHVEAALACFDRALAADPDDLASLYWRASAYSAAGRWPEAVADLRHVVQHKPESVPSWLDLGEAYLAMGRRAEALSAVEQALRLDAGNATAKELLSRLEQPVDAATVTPEPGPRAAGPRPLLPQVDATLGARVAFGSGGIQLSPASVDVQGQRLYDYTFGSAPVDWQPAGGTWAISSRYACEPEWSFFGGQSRGICAIWNKRRFKGDIAVEAYLAFKHGLPWASEQWHYVPTDLNLNLGSREGDLASGHSFIYSGRNSSVTMIRRGATILAQTSEERALAPQFSDTNPLYQVDDQGRPFGALHRHWWRLEARRTGSRLTFAVDGKQVLEVTDPDPPPDEGQVAIWTVGSGIVIARVRIAYAQELREAQPAVVVDAPVPLDAAADRVARR